MARPQDTFAMETLHGSVQATLVGDLTSFSAANPASSYRYRIQFTASGVEYFKIWIVNLALSLLTLGLYLPWARVRRLHYFYRNTLIDGHALDFDGSPDKLLRGALVVLSLLTLYLWAVRVEPLAALVAIAAMALLRPLLFRAGMRYRLSHTRWRGLRVEFVDEAPAEAWACFTPPMLLLLVPAALLPFWGGMHNDQERVAVTAIGASLALWALLSPYFQWRQRRYLHTRLAFGGQRAQFRSTPRDMYLLALRTLAPALLVLGFGAFTVFFGNGLLNARYFASHPVLAAAQALAMLFVLMACFNVLPRALWQAQMQNLVWSRTGNDVFRFKSRLPSGAYVALQLKNYLFIFLTLGLYWPFAVVATQRMRLESVRLKSRVCLETLMDQSQRPSSHMLGDAAVGMLGMDMGM